MSSPKSPDDRDTLYALAHERRQAGDRQGAIDIFFELLARNLRDQEVTRDLAALLAEDDQLERAERLFRHALKICGDDPFLAVNYATYLSQAGRLEEGLELLEEQRSAIARRLAQAEAQADEDQVRELREGLGIVTINAALSATEVGDARTARDLAEPYLADPRFWEGAHDVVYRAIEQLGDDHVAIARTLHAAGRASPVMIWQLVEACAEETYDAIAAAGIVLDARRYLTGPMFATATREYERPNELERWLFAELRRRTGLGEAAAQSVLNELEALSLR